MEWATPPDRNPGKPGKEDRRMKTISLLSLIALGLAAPSLSAQGLPDKAGKGAAGAGVVDNIGTTPDPTAASALGDEDPQAIRDRIDAMAEASLFQLFAERWDAGLLYEIATGYAVFDTSATGAPGTATGTGRGVAVDLDIGARTYMDMGVGDAGPLPGTGGIETRIVILFQPIASFDSFIADGYDATALPGSIFDTRADTEALRFINGRSVFVLDRTGWKAATTIAGTRYWPDTDLN